MSKASEWCEAFNKAKAELDKIIEECPTLYSDLNPHQREILAHLDSDGGVIRGKTRLNEEETRALLEWLQEIYK